VDYYKSDDEDPNEDNDVDFVVDNELEEAASISHSNRVVDARQHVLGM